MKIVLVGYGKMGKMIEETARERGHDVALRIDENNQDNFNELTAENIDVAIEFTAPQCAFANVIKCIDLNIPVVSGSTGWNEQLPAAKDYCGAKGGTMLHSSNFSVGVNIFFRVNKALAKLMRNQPGYNVQITETHHTQKKDAPSGTAVTLAEQIIAQSDTKKAWVNSPAAQAGQLSIISKRIDPAPGTHQVAYSSSIDTIELVHTAHSRRGFALGAVLAAEFLAGKNGIFSMDDVLDL